MKVIDDNIVHNHATIVNNIQTVRYDKKKKICSTFIIDECLFKFIVITCLWIDKFSHT